MQSSIIARTAIAAQKPTESSRRLRLSRSDCWHLTGVLALLGSSVAYAAYALFYSFTA